MISRAAECCFWLQRYMERLDGMARLLDVNGTFALETADPDLESWRPILVVAGEEPNYLELIGTVDEEAVQEYLTWDERNPVSIRNSAYWARENGRTIREVMSLEMWEILNTFWIWMNGGAGRRAYRQDRNGFYVTVKQSAQLFRGASHDSMLHEEAFDFMRLGMLLERAGQTARILDVKYHLLGPTRPESESPIELAHWFAILRSCMASEAFLKRRHAGSGSAVAEFLILDPVFPLSIAHCVDRSRNFVNRIRRGDEDRIGKATQEQLDALCAHLGEATIETVLQRGIHYELTDLIGHVATICTSVHQDFFDPAPPMATRDATRTQDRSAS